MRLNTIVVFLLGLVIEVMMPVDGSNAILVDTDEIPIELTAGEALGCVMKRKPIPGRARYPDRGFEIRMKTTTDGGLVLFEFTDFTKKLLIYKIERRNGGVEMMVEDDIFIGKPDDQGQDWEELALRFIPQSVLMIDQYPTQTLQDCRQILETLKSYNSAPNESPIDWISSFYNIKETQMREEIRNRNKAASKEHSI